MTILILVVGLAWSCANEPDEKKDNLETLANNNEVKMAEWSELALLMRQIHKDAKKWKTMLEKGELVTDSANIYKQLVESTPTDAAVKGPSFEGFAMNYQTALTDFIETNDILLAKEKYNNLVSTCISCHQSYCPGPVKTIKKLYIPKD